ncbi:MAG: aminotransferase class IV [Paludibacteraceae bacterium]|nr:aminotransferase class IV [Paludibacteraceae bacterium]
MCQAYFESIKVENGVPLHLEYHQRRVDRCSAVNLVQTTDTIPLPNNGIYKLRISYTPIAVVKVSIEEYSPKTIDTLKIIDGGNVDYSLKYDDRSVLNKLHNQRDLCDDVLIIKDGKITDTSFCNIVFSDGFKWVTPKRPLLEGTCRARLICEGKISEEDITVDDLDRYKYYMLINAMLDFNLNRQKCIDHIVRS